jgi:hypothetical protein
MKVEVPDRVKAAQQTAEQEEKRRGPASRLQGIINEGEAGLHGGDDVIVRDVLHGQREVGELAGEAGRCLRRHLHPCITPPGSHR